MSNSFFAGLEAFMEDNPVEASASVSIKPEENIEEVSEADAVATEQGKLNTEIQEIDDKAEMYLREFDRIDQMIAHVEKYGVDRSFLSICNHNNMLSNIINVNLPACESFDVVGSSSSAVSIAALEGLKEVATKIYDFIVSMCLRMKDWIVRFAKMYDLRINSLKKRADALESLAKTNTQRRAISTEDEEKLKDVKVFKLSELDSSIVKTCSEAMEKINNVKLADELEKLTLDEFKMPNKVSLNDLSETEINSVVDYASLALTMAKGAEDFMKHQLPNLRKSVEQLKSDANSKKIDKDVAKFELAKRKLCIRIINESIGRFLKTGNAAISSGSTILSKFFQKP